MIFSTFKFIFLFFPIVFGVYRILNHFKWNTISKLWLVLASFYFYAQGSPDFFPFFWGSVFFNYIVGNTLGKMRGENEKSAQRKILLLIGILANVALLGYYKYIDFFIENYNYLTDSALELKNIILPIGISFFTFQLIAFLVDAYRGECKNYDVVDYLLFITFFPQLIVGPIIHHSEIIPQFSDKDNCKVNYDNIAKGIFLFSIGCFKKIMLADVLTTDAQAYFNAIAATDALTMAQTWFHSVEYTISYYFDLSGYADMAIGLGLMFNIIIPHNFNSPYKARNFQDYWRRWHMTLSRFLGDYIFKSVYKKGSKYRNYYIATMVTFFVSGFWHGAGWTFVVWGLVNGIFVCVASWMKRHEWRLPSILAYPLTGLGIILTRVLFISPTFDYAKNIYRGMIHINSGLGTIKNEILYCITSNKTVTVTLIVGILLCWFAPNSKDLQEKFKPTLATVLWAGVAFVICILNMNKVATFLYFQF